MNQARKTDPQTSHEAARSVKNSDLKIECLLKALARPRTDEGMIEAYRNMKKSPMASESGLRTLRVYLYRQGLVRDTGERRKTASGRNAIVWQAESNN